uniref:(northern house mosquito) hypothetical protein n=1 Tax=Culex pipiens TaxID=7175 RepID=A0A8D8NES6_CULPI
MTQDELRQSFRPMLLAKFQSQSRNIRFFKSIFKKDRNTQPFVHLIYTKYFKCSVVDPLFAYINRLDNRPQSSNKACSIFQCSAYITLRFFSIFILQSSMFHYLAKK